MIGAGGRAIEAVRLAQHEDVRPTAERIAIDGDRMQVRVGVGALRLVRGAAVVVPHGQILDGGRRPVEGAVFATQSLAGAVNPDVGGLDLVGGQRQRQVLVQQRFVDGRVRRQLEGFRHDGAGCVGGLGEVCEC